MITIENEALGYYKLGFLNIKINTDEDLKDLNKLVNSQSKVFSTFLHEYIHFLQNFTTTSGLYSSSFYTQFIKYLVHKVKDNPSHIIHLPMNIDNDFNRASFIKLNSVYLGKSGFIRNRVIYNSYRAVEEEIEDISREENIKPKKYLVNFTNTENHKTEDYHFGIIALKEYVAHKIQNKFHPTEHPDIPYLIAELILDKELPDFNEYTDLKILICDASLMTLHPAQFFFNTIHKLKNDLKIPKKPNEFYNYIFKDLQFKGEIGNMNNQIQLFHHTHNEVLKDYKDIFSSPIFRNELHWFQLILKSSRELRLKHPTFMLDLINDKGKFTATLKRIFKNLGTPFFINNKSEGGFIPPRKLKHKPDQVYILLAASELLNNMFSNNSCSMYNFCSTNFEGKNPTNSFCISNPFLKLKEKDACSFSQLCKTWGIDKKTYNKKS